MRKRLYFLCMFLALTGSARADRSVLRDNEEAQERPQRVVTSKKTVTVCSSTKKEVKKTPVASQKKPVSVKKETTYAQQEVVTRIVSPEIAEHPHRSIFRYEWEEQPFIESERTKQRHAKKIALAEQKKDQYYCCTEEPEDYSKLFYTDVAVGFLKYLMPSAQIPGAYYLPAVTPPTVAYVTNPISKDHASAAPLVRAGFGVELVGIPTLWNKSKTTRMRLGWQALFAKKTNAVTTFYTNNGNTSPNLRGMQSIMRGEFMAMMSYDLLRDMFSIEGGLGVVGGALTDLGLYQVGPHYEGTDAYKPYGQPDLIFTGQTLVANKASVGGFIGFTISHRFECLNNTRCEFGYRSVFNTVKYKRQVEQTVPDAAASTAYQDAYALVQANGPISLLATPEMKVRAQEITFGMVLEF